MSIRIAPRPAKGLLQGVEPDAVIVAVDEGLDVGAQVIEIPTGVREDLLPLERLQKTLTAGVVIGVRQPTPMLGIVSCCFRIGAYVPEAYGTPQSE